MSMELLFKDQSYDRLEVDATFTHGFPSEVVTLYRKRLQIVRAARDEGDLEALQCLRFTRAPQGAHSEYSIDLNDHFQLIVEVGAQRPITAVLVITIRACPATTS